MPDPATIPQFGFHDGVLSIRAPEGDMRIRWRPKPSAEWKLPGRGWVEFWPEFRLLRPASAGLADDDSKRQAYEAFRAEIPELLVSVVEPFGSHQWSLLKLLGERPDAVDLARANPVLAYALANNYQFRRVRQETAATQAIWYCGRKQRVILQWLGFPGTPAAVRLLHKVVPEAAAPTYLRLLRNALAGTDTVSRLLAHQRRITVGVIFLVCQAPLVPYVTPKLLAEVAERDEEIAAAPTADALSSVLAMLLEMRGEHRLRPFSGIGKLAEVHRDVLLEYQAHKARGAPPAARKTRRAFGPPPIPGNEQIVPIVCGEELELEGRTQRNCVASYERLIREGGPYVYKVLHPQRATLAISLGPDGCWRRCELKAKANAPVRQETVRLVDRWLSRHGISA